MLADVLSDKRQQSVIFTAAFSLLVLFFHYNYLSTGTRDILRPGVKNFPYRIDVQHNETERPPVVNDVHDLEQAPHNATLGV